MTSTLTPFAARLHSLAAFITEHDLPPAAISIHADAQIIALAFHQCEQPENALYRWAQALDLVVRTVPYEDEQGCASEILSASGFIDGVHHQLSWARPVLATVPA